MEKLKVKHDHKLTDILKVGIFALFLIMPFLLFLPSCTYYAVNKYAEPNEDTIETYEQKVINFNQLVVNGNFENNNYWSGSNATISVENNTLTMLASGYRGALYPSNTFRYLPNTENQVVVVRCDILTDAQANQIRLYSYGGYATTSNIASDTWQTLTIYTKTNNTWAHDLTNNNTFRVEDMRQSNYNEVKIRAVNAFNLTTMFGEGNEPTKEEFNSLFPNYYPYTENERQTITIETGTTTYKNVVDDINYNWQKLWNLPILNWTNNTILKQGLDNFTLVFGITNISYITNLITYELIIVAIYIVIDIVLTLFKWLTHMVGSKE